MTKNRIQLGWFNTWVGLVWMIMFVPCILYFFNHELFLSTRFSKEGITKFTVFTYNNRSSMKIETPDKGVFHFYDNEFFDKIIEELRTANKIEIWYNKENRVIVDIKINKSYFIIPRSKLANTLYLFCLLLSGFTLTVSIIVIVKTKGWGSYDLLEKYPEGLRKHLLDAWLGW